MTGKMTQTEKGPHRLWQWVYASWSGSCYSIIWEHTASMVTARLFGSLIELGQISLMISATVQLFDRVSFTV